MAKAKRPNPQVVQARQQAVAAARAGGAKPPAARRAGRQAAAAARQGINQPMPQPPAPSGPAGGGYYQYSPTAESGMNQPYQDLAAAGATGALGGVLGRMPQQSQLGDIYGQYAAGSLGGAANAMGQLAPTGGQAAGLAGGTMGQYGALMGYNMPIQQGVANEIMGIQAGNLDVDPAMVQQFGQQEQLLNEQLRRQLGPDYATSSAGIEALGRFQQGRQAALGQANYNRLQSLIGMQQGGLQNLTGQGINFGQYGAGLQGQQFGQGQQMGAQFGQNAMDMYNQAMGLRTQQLGGAGQMLNQAGQIQGLYAGIPQTMGQFGQAMSGQAGAAVGAQGPYQQDRFGQLQASYAPTKGAYTGMMLQNQGDRLINSASAMGGGSSSPPQQPDYGQSSQMMTPYGGGGGGGWPMGGY
jgi:hypothetical protein